MVKEAVNHIENTPIDHAEIGKYILDHFGSVNLGTIGCQITSCTVNMPSRVHYAENQKPRLCTSQYDFLFSVGRGKVVPYNPQEHGLWAIELSEGKAFVVKKSESMAGTAIEKPEISQPPRSAKNREIPNVNRPSEAQVKHYIAKWNDLKNYTMQESALNKLFTQTYPTNTDIDDILIKVSALNDFYSTNIFSVFSVAKHIAKLQIDNRLSKSDETLVNEIALVKTENGSTKNFYSFATKYCSHHRPYDYPIFDSYVEKVLKHFRDQKHFAQFNNGDLRDYVAFKNILLQFKHFYGISYSLKDIDRYLWQLGKDVFPIIYKKKQTT